ncbi:MAG: hypothetical protein ACK559_30300, partial [bacterium]
AAQAAVKGQIAQITAQQKQLNDTYGDTENKQKSLTGQLRQLKQELSLLEAAGEEGSQQFQELTLRAAKLEDQIGDTRERVRVLASDTFKFDAAVGAVSTLASGFEVAQGAAALFGSESEALNEVIAKTTAVTAIANGVREIADTLTGQSAVKLAVLGAAQKAYNVVVGNSTGALKIFRIALASTGVGALVAGLGVLIAYFDDIKDAINGTSNSTRAYAKAVEESRSKTAEAIVTVQEVGNAFDLAKQGVISKEEALLTYNEKLGESLGTQNDFNAAEKRFVLASGAYVKSAQLRATAQSLIAEGAALAAEAATVTGDEALSTLETIDIYAGKIGNAFNDVLTLGLLDLSEGEEKRAAAVKESAKVRVSAEKQAEADRLFAIGEGIVKEAEELEKRA